MATVPHNSFRATVPQGIVFGGAEDQVAERSECHNDEIGVENADFSWHATLEPQMWCKKKHGNIHV